MLRTQVDRIRDRPAGLTPLDAVVDMLSQTMTASPVCAVTELERLHRTIGDNAGLRARMLLVTIYRTMASPEVMAYLRAHPKNQRRKAFGDWLQVARELTGAGIGDYARRTA